MERLMNGLERKEKVKSAKDQVVQERMFLFLCSD